MAKQRFNPGTGEEYHFIRIRLKPQMWDRLCLIAQRYNQTVGWLITQVLEKRIKNLYVPEEGEYQAKKKNPRKVSAGQTLKTLNELMRKQADGTAEVP